MDKISTNTANITSNGIVSNQSASIEIENNEVNLEYNKNDKVIKSNRLNALDSQLLEDNAYRDLKDENFKIEYRIGKLESELIFINKQLETSKKINDTDKTDALSLKKHSIEKELQKLYAEYKGNNLSKKITDTITRPRNNIFEQVINGAAQFISDKILPKISSKFHSGQSLKLALDKLENINRNVDELVSLNTPYGEEEDKYERLTNYLAKASIIQYNISKSLSGEDSKIKYNPFAEMTSKEKAEEKAKKLLSLNKKKDLAQKNALNLNNNLSG